MVRGNQGISYGLKDEAELSGEGIQVGDEARQHPDRVETVGQRLQEDLPDWVTDLVVKWKALLRLMDWDISVCMTDTIMHDPGLLALVSIEPSSGKSAIIDITYRMDRESARQQETIIIHELLHILLYDMSSYSLHYLPKKATSWHRNLVETSVGTLTQIFYSILGNEVILESEDKEG